MSSAMSTNDEDRRGGTRVPDPMDDTYRQLMNQQLTVQESRHRLARAICHGGRGPIRQAHRDGQEDQLAALGLVLNAVVLWNNRYLDAAIAQLRTQGHDIKDEDVARLSPPREDRGIQREAEVALSEEIRGAAEEFERSANWLRSELRAIAAAVARGVEPEVEERIQERRTTRGAMGSQFTMRMTLPGTPYASAAASDAMVAAGWCIESSEGVWGPHLNARRDGFEAGLFSRPFGGMGVWGKAPTVWFHARWIRPPRAATPQTMMPGYRLCRMCDGWGTCTECEGLGFINGQRCIECGLGMDCLQCGGTGQQRLDS